MKSKHMKEVISKHYNLQSTEAVQQTKRTAQKKTAQQKKPEEKKTPNISSDVKKAGAAAHKAVKKSVRDVYKARMQALQVRAQAEIEMMEKKGFVVSEAVRNRAYGEIKTVSKKRYKTMQTALSMQRLHEVARLQITTVHKNKEYKDLTKDQYFTVDIRYADLSNPKKLAKKVNAMLHRTYKKNGKRSPLKSADLAQTAMELAVSLTKQYPKAGTKNQYFEVKKSFDTHKFGSFKEAVKFLEIPADFDALEYIKEIASHAYASAAGKKVWQAEVGKKTVDTLMAKNNISLSEDELDILKDIVYSSHLFHIFQKVYEDSEQVVSEVMEFITKAQGLTNEDLSNLIQLIKNEESLDVVYAEVDRLVEKTKKARGLQ